jgi:flagellin-like protein
MNTIGHQKRAISPIIATLLLILIAIAAGVVVYAYVLGFVGNSTGNSGATTDTLSIDQLNLRGSSVSAMPVTAYVRNEGPSTEGFNTGFYIKSSSINDLLGPALVLSGSGTTDTLTAVSLSGVSGTPTSLTVTMIITCSASTDVITVQAFGVSVASSGSTGSCVTGMTLTLASLSFSTPSNFAANSGPSFSVNIGSNSKNIVGTQVTTGTMSVAINNVATFTLASFGLQSSNPLSTGSSYTFQVTGADGGSTTSSAKAS